MKNKAQRRRAREKKRNEAARKTARKIADRLLGRGRHGQSKIRLVKTSY